MTDSRCDTEVYEKGQSVGLFECSSHLMEGIRGCVIRETEEKVDWHYAGGRVNLLHVGTDEGRKKVIATLNKLKNCFDTGFIYNE